MDTFCLFCKKSTEIQDFEMHMIGCTQNILGLDNSDSDFKAYVNQILNNIKLHSRYNLF
jgi:hypothetical protein